VRTDSLLFMELGRAEQEMSALFRDIRRNPVRYVHF